MGLTPHMPGQSCVGTDTSDASCTPSTAHALNTAGKAPPHRRPRTPAHAPHYPLPRPPLPRPRDPPLWPRPRDPPPRPRPPPPPCRPPLCRPPPRPPRPPPPRAAPRRPAHALRCRSAVPSASQAPRPAAPRARTFFTRPRSYSASHSSRGCAAGASALAGARGACQRVQPTRSCEGWGAVCAALGSALCQNQGKQPGMCNACTHQL